MKKLLPLYVLLMTICSGLFGDDVTGFWKTINDQTGKPESIMAIYPYQGKYYGRLVATYDNDGKITDTIDNPIDRAPGVEGEPYYSGLDIMWDLKEKDGKYVDGKIMDPEKGRIYDAEMWIKDGVLVVRGKIWFFGANQEWPRVVDSDFSGNFHKPDLTKFVPVIPKVKKQKKPAAKATKSGENEKAPPKL